MRTHNETWKHIAIAAACAMSLAGQCAAADMKGEMPSAMMEGKHAMDHGASGGMDWIKHTQDTLAELKHKLNLTPAQGPAWDTWSAGVAKDADQQLTPESTACEHKHGKPGGEDLTTPEQMQQGIACLRNKAAAMEAHLTQLEAAQARTKTFYDALDVNQRTIFDMFWRELHHRVPKGDGERPMDGACRMGNMSAHGMK